MIDRQKVFDEVAPKLVQQAAKSVIVSAHHKEICAYRGTGGVRCAIGHLIPDEAYTVLIESRPVSILLKQEALHDNKLQQCVLALRERLGVAPEELMCPDDVTFLRDLQMVHDDAPDGASRSEWIDRLNWFARKYNLTPIKET